MVGGLRDVRAYRRLDDLSTAGLLLDELKELLRRRDEFRIAGRVRVLDLLDERALSTLGVWPLLNALDRLGQFALRAELLYELALYERVGVSNGALADLTHA